MPPRPPPSRKFPVMERAQLGGLPHGWLALAGTGLGTGLPVPHLAAHDAG